MTDYDPELAATSRAFYDQLLVSLSTPGGAVSYRAKVAGVDCIVVGFARTYRDDHADVVPLAIVVTNGVHEILETDEEE